MASSAMSGASRRWAGRVLIGASVLAFVLYFILVVSADLFPLEQFGATVAASGDIATVTTVVSGSPAARAGLQAGDDILALDGRRVRNALDWASVFAGVEAQRPIVATVRRGGSSNQVSVAFVRRPGAPWATLPGALNLLARCVQFVTLVFAVLIVGRGQRSTTMPGAWLLATIAIYTVGLPPGMAAAWRRLPTVLQLLLYVPSISKVLIGPILFVFFRALLGLRLAGRVRLLVVIPALVMATWDVVFITALLEGSPRIADLTAALNAIIGVNFAYVVATVTTLIRRYPMVPTPAERRRLRWVAAGTILGCAAGAPTVAGLWLGVSDDPTVIYHTPTSLQVGYMLFLLMPVSLWRATASGELFDLGFVVRRGLQYAFARRALLVGTPTVIALVIVDAMRHRSESLADIISSHGVVYVLTTIALVAFATQRTRWLTWLDRRLFRERYDASRLLRDMALTARTTRDLEMAAEFAVSRIEAALHPEFVGVYACPRGNSPALVAAAGHLGDESHSSSIHDAARSLRQPVDFGARSGAWSAAGHPPDMSALVRGGVRLIIPMFERVDSPQGYLMLGGKRSGEPYSQEDKTLLQAVAESLGELLEGPRSIADRPEVPSATTADQRLWLLAGAVAGGQPVDWAAESASIGEDESRQVLLELESLERLMHIHGADIPSTGNGSQPSAVEAVRRWGPFELRGRLGAGRFGTVHRAWDPTLEREVAIKLLETAAVDRAAYLREARHLARVHHPNVVSVFGADEFDGLPGFWMELIEGETLAGAVKHRGPFDLRQTAAVGEAMCRALQAIHAAGLVHQDVKAGNIVLEPGGRLVLMDLGASTRGADQPRYGTPAYMAPEVSSGGAASARSDVYSLGVLLFHLLTGTFPCAGQPAAQHTREPGDLARQLRLLDPPVPEHFATAIDRAARVDAGARFATAEEFRMALDLHAHTLGLNEQVSSGRGRSE